MLNRPKWKSFYEVEVIGEDSVLLASEDKSTVIDGKIYTLVAPYLKGTFTTDQICDQLESKASFIDVYQALTLLEKSGHIAEADGNRPQNVEAFWQMRGVDLAKAHQRGENVEIKVASLGGIEAERFVSLLSASNIRVKLFSFSDISLLPPDSSSLHLVLTDNYLHSRLDAFNRDALDSGKLWMLARPVGTVIWLGPIFQPRQTGCWECLAERLGRNLMVAEFIRKQRNTSEMPVLAVGATTLSTSLALHHLALEISHWIEKGSSDLLGKVRSLDMNNYETRLHVLVQRPQCSVCGHPEISRKRFLEPIHLGSKEDVFHKEGGYRSISPGETLKRFEHHISPITGLITDIKQMDVQDKTGLFHTYWAGVNFSRGQANTLDFLRQAFRSNSGGKGTTAPQGKVGALCEAIERTSGIYQGYEGVLSASFKELGKEAIHPHQILQFSEKQYQSRLSLNKDCSDFHWNPEPFDEERKVEWTPVWSLTYQKQKYIPTALCYYGYSYKKDDAVFAKGCSNGNAAGNTLEEAILQGFMELVERDAVALWWYNRLHRPGVDIESFNDPYAMGLIDHYKKIGREVWVLDIISDLGIPAFVALIRKIKGSPEQILYAFGAHFDPKIALLRALTEMNQCKYMLENEKESLDSKVRGLTQWMKEATIHNQPYLLPASSSEKTKYQDFQKFLKKNLVKNVDKCVALAQGKGLEVLVLDQTRPDIGLPVVKVFVPGMVHFWPRFGARRLYEVPVKMGWLSKEYQEEELNPWPIYL